MLLLLLLLRLLLLLPLIEKSVYILVSLGNMGKAYQ